MNRFLKFVFDGVMAFMDIIVSNGADGSRG